LSLFQLAAGAASLALLAAPRAPAAVQREIALRGPGRVAITLDGQVYEHARPDLGDLRIIDDLGRETPYVRQWAPEDHAPALRVPATMNRGFVRGRSATATLDFAAPTPKRELVLSLSGHNFRRRVMVEGRSRTDGQWTTLTDGAYVFAVPGPPPARYETVSLPENDFVLLRVSAFRGDDDPAIIEIRQASIRPAPEHRPREAPLESAGYSFVAQEGRARDTLVTLDLRWRSQPVRAVMLHVADERFFREVVVEARRPAPTGWVPIATGAVYRYQEGGRVHERLRVDACGREDALRVRIRNRDDRPLQVETASVLGAVGRLAFEVRPGRRYTLQYGAPDRAAPSYDLERTVGDTAAWIAGAAEAFLLSPDLRRIVVHRAWTERHPTLLWAGLVAAAAVLGALTWRAIRASG
jgi:hypothetical protein